MEEQQRQTTFFAKTFSFPYFCALSTIAPVSSTAGRAIFKHALKCLMHLSRLMRLLRQARPTRPTHYATPPARAKPVGMNINSTKIKSEEPVLSQIGP
jgi:hypothetical protein